jgi:hypothetical protein
VSVTQIPSDKPNLQRLPDHLAQRVLARASEIDAAGAAVTDLREAAREAGISQAAFEAALAEVQTVNDAAVPIAKHVPAPRPRRFLAGMIGGAVMVFFLVMMVFIPRAVSTVVPIASDGAPIVEQSFPLRCISPAQAGELIRPLVGASGTVVLTPPTVPGGVVTVRASEEQLKQVKALLDRYEGAPGAACAIPLPGTPAPTPPAR